jgi:GST-like protein
VAKPAAPARRAASAKTKAAATSAAKTKPATRAKLAATAARKAPVARSATATPTRRRANAPSKEIQVYFWPTPNGQKVTIMLEECGLPYRIVPVNIAKGDQFKKSFLNIAPNNRMPALVDPAGPSNKPIALFESGAILRYLGEKTGKFYPKQPRARYEVDVWLFWQMGGLGPMAGQAHHFRQYAPETIPYAVDRYTNEVNRLYGVLDKRLKGRDFICDRYSIADMASWPWVKLYEMQGQDIDAFKNLKKWLERVGNRKATMRGFEAGKELRQQAGDLRSDPKARAVLFSQRAR